MALEQLLVLSELGIIKIVELLSSFQESPFVDMVPILSIILWEIFSTIWISLSVFVSPNGSYRNPNGRDTRSDKKIGTIRKEQNKKK